VTTTAATTLPSLGNRREPVERLVGVEGDDVDEMLLERVYNAGDWIRPEIPTLTDGQSRLLGLVQTRGPELPHWNEGAVPDA
jgi:hypothetical protein